MRTVLSINLYPKQAADENSWREVAARKLKIHSADISFIRIIRRSVDARGKNVKINLGLEVFTGELPDDNPTVFEYQWVGNKPEVLIVGAGPAGLFAALRLTELGFKPVIFERGKDVSSRKRDIAAIHRNEGINPDSNYGFGEGGAGTFSDGKLYTRSKKKGNIKRILELFHYHGAQDDILIDSHPHIGTNVLPRVIQKMRETIRDAGGVINFNSRVTGLVIKSDAIIGLKINDNMLVKGEAVILATGHSARETYYHLKELGLKLEAKNFAIGVRVEHPQQLIDQIQYHQPERGKYLPAAKYNFAEQVNGRGVYSFCMCPGGVIVPASTSNNEMVVNGMSPSERSGIYANSGIVTEVRIDDLKIYEGYEELAGLKFQEEIEQKSFNMAGNSHYAPAQRLADFVAGKASGSLPKTSYHPGISPSDLHLWLPGFIVNGLQKGFRQMFCT